jgi:hypothetical protein
MAQEYISIDISNAPDLQRLAEAVRQSGKPHALKQGADIVAIIRPAPKRERRASPPRRPRRSSPFTLDDPLWQVMGIAKEAGPEDVAAHKDRYLAKAYAAKSR